MKIFFLIFLNTHEANIVILGNNDSAIKRYFISKMDLLFLLEANYSEGIFLPSKMVDYYQVNRAILAMGPSNLEVQAIVNQYGGGVYVSYSESDDFKGKLFDLFQLWKDQEIDSYVTNSTLSRIFDPQVIIKKYEDLFDTIIKSKKSNK